MPFSITRQSLMRTIWFSITTLALVQANLLSVRVDEQYSSSYEDYSSETTYTPNAYTSVVVFGASWADNGHPRPAQYSGTLRGPPNYKGRYSNGIIWAEYLANKLITGQPIPLLDYAYGGAVANNNLTYTDKPDTKTQTSQYISDVKAKTVNRGSGTVLHIWWIGINSITQIWTDAIKKDPSVRSQAVLDEANARVDQQIAEVESQVRNVRTDAEVNKLPGQFLVLPIPPMEMVLTFQFQAKDLSKNNTQLAALYIELIGRLSLRYNQGLERLDTSMNSYQAGTGSVKTYDFPKLWQDMTEDPSKYGLNVTDQACLHDVNGTQVVCSNPDQYLYWDTLHPTTAAHQIMAEHFVSTINS